tara:strand:+ start:7695 stop:8891 length:1197 start_codon:yes stop_codon:yes gene_type:complete
VVINLTETEKFIREDILDKGKISFARFVEIALYHPEFGYYSKINPIGINSHYITSPYIHPAFGSAISKHIFLMWKFMKTPNKFQIVELGCSTGILAETICSYAKNISKDFSNAIDYFGIDRSINKKYNFQSIKSNLLPLKNISGCIISNELIDSLPFHRFKIINHEIKEIYVTIENGTFTTILDKPSSKKIEQKLNTLKFKLPNNFEGEICLEIEKLFSSINKTLTQGFIITIDYGEEREYLYENKPHGTMQTYFKHTTGASPFNRIGEQDITANIDFSSLIEAGILNKIRPVTLCSQKEFLEIFGIKKWTEKIQSSKSLKQIEKQINLMNIKKLVQYPGLGNFKILIQEKNTGLNKSNKILPEIDSQKEIFSNLPIPVNNISNYENKYSQFGNFIID